MTDSSGGGPLLSRGGTPAGRPNRVSSCPRHQEARGVRARKTAGVGFAFDLVGQRDRSFRWIEKVAERAQGRMFVTHLTLVFGMGAMMVWGAPSALFAVFMGFKTLVDLGSLLPDREPSPTPAGMLAGLDQVGPSREGLVFSQHYRQGIAQDRIKREASQRVLETPESPR